MSILPGSLIASVERIPATSAVRRVERDRGADEFNQRQQNAPDDEPSDHDETDDVLPEDVVDVSGIYQAAHVPMAHPALQHPVSSLHVQPTAQERHIDIEG